LTHPVSPLVGNELAMHRMTPSW